MSRDLIYEKLIRPFLFQLDPELVHHAAASALSAARPVLPLWRCDYKSDDLKTELFGTVLNNPVGLAAGFDKNGLLFPAIAQLGFAYAEIGSVCARPHGGNLRPRLFRLPDDRALINRLGLNGLGAEVVASNLARLQLSLFPIGVNIAKTNDSTLTGDKAVQDVIYSFQRLKDLPVKYVTINTSCPNTDEGCLKESEFLAEVLQQVAALNSTNLPLLLKLSPDSSDEFIQELLTLGTKYKVSGFVCGNTTLRRDMLQTEQNRIAAIGAGGLSGAPLKELNLELTRKVARWKLPRQIIIGVGGIECGADLFDYLSAGAHLVQIYTGFVYRGPSAVKGMCEELSNILKAKGVTLSQLSDTPVSI